MARHLSGCSSGWRSEMHRRVFSHTPCRANFTIPCALRSRPSSSPPAAAVVAGPSELISVGCLPSCLTSALRRHDERARKRSTVRDPRRPRFADTSLCALHCVLAASSLLSYPRAMSSPVVPAPAPAFESGASADHSNLQMRLDSLVGLPPVPTAAGYTLRTLTPSDRDGVSALMVAAFGDAHGAWTPERVDSVLTNEPSVTKTFVLEQEGTGTIVATASARLLPGRFPGAGYLHWVAVHPAYQSAGLGRLVSGCATRVLWSTRTASVGVGDAG